MRLLFVEDDSLLGGGLRAALAKSGFDVVWVRDGKAALDALPAERFAVMVLDIGLPGLSGLDVLRQMRSQGYALPVLILTARETTRDKVMCLDAGADDYLVKTADMEELVARLRALIRRSGRGLRQHTVGDLTLDLDSHAVTRNGEVINVSRREFEVLRALMEVAGRVLTRRQLEQSLYGWDSCVDSNAIEVHVHNLRQKLGPSMLKTIRGVGYTLVRVDP